MLLVILFLLAALYVRLDIADIPGVKQSTLVRYANDKTPSDPSLNWPRLWFP